MLPRIVSTTLKP